MSDVQTLVQKLTSRPDNIGRHTVIQSDPFNWETYSRIEELGLLKDVPKTPWDQGQHHLPNPLSHLFVELFFLSSSSSQSLPVCTNAKY